MGEKARKLAIRPDVTAWQMGSQDVGQRSMWIEGGTGELRAPGLQAPRVKRTLRTLGS